MPAQLNIFDQHGVTAPPGCTVNSVDRQDSQPVKEYVDDQGNSQPFQLKMKTATVTVKGKGYPSMSLISTALDDISAGEAHLTGLTVEEGAEEVPDFTLEAVIYS